MLYEVITNYKKSNMNPDKIWLSSPHMGGNEKKYIESAFAENIVAPLGPNVTVITSYSIHYTKLYDISGISPNKTFIDRYG